MRNKDLNMKIVIVYCSPAGSTRHVAEVIHNSFNQRNVGAVMLDLAKGHDRPEALEVIKTANQKVCLFIGSPVYRDVAIPPVMNFIEERREIMLQRLSVSASGPSPSARSLRFFYRLIVSFNTSIIFSCENGDAPIYS